MSPPEEILTTSDSTGTDSGTGKGTGTISKASSGRIRGLGTARHGTGHWLAQRLTAVALVPLGLWFAVSTVAHVGSSHAEAATWLAEPMNAVLMLLLIGAGFHHMQLGLQVVIEDYVAHEGWRFVLISAQRLITIGLAVAAGFAVLKTAFGG